MMPLRWSKSVVDDNLESQILNDTDTPSHQLLIM